MKKRPLIYGILCGALITTALQWRHYYQLPESEDYGSPGDQTLLVPSTREGGRSGLRASLRRGFSEGVSDGLLEEFANRSAQEMARLMDETRFIEDEKALWEAAVEKLAFEDLEKAVELAKLAPPHVFLEDVLVAAIAGKGDLARLTLLIHYPISRKAIARGLAMFLDEGPDAAALQAIRDLVQMKGKITTGDWSQMMRALPDNRTLPLSSIRSLIDPALLDEGFRPGMLPYHLGDAGASVEEIEALTLKMARGNTALASESLAQWAGQRGRRLELQSRSQADQAIKSRALSQYSVNGGNSPLQALEWAVGLEDSKVSGISFHEIFSRQLTGNAVHQKLILDELNTLAKTTPDAPVLTRATEWLRELSQSDPAKYEAILPSIEKQANGSFTRMFIAR